MVAAAAAMERSARGERFFDELMLEASVSGVASDYTNDGVVTLADYPIWRDHLGLPPATLDNGTTGASVGALQDELRKEEDPTNATIRDK